MIRAFAGFIVAATMVTWLTSAANAQDKSGVSGPDPGPAPSQTDQAGLGDIMAMQQTRHIKLWFAGSAGNWPLADYEIGELKDGFSDVDQLLGGGTVDKAVGAQLSALEKAIAGKNRDAFVTAFDDLSAGCNTCHQLLDHGFIVIQRPASLPYTDQSFTTK
jgi:hypothetical protein